MLNNRIEQRNRRQQQYQLCAQLAKVFSSPRRLEILDALIQRPRSVEDLASAVGQPLATTSQHLQILFRAKVVRKTRNGTSFTYFLLDEVRDLFVSLRALAEDINPELMLLRTEKQGSIQRIEYSDVRTLLDSNQAILLDVRSVEEFNNIHIRGALSIPLDQLHLRSSELPSEKKIIITCRGPYCISSVEAVSLLLEQGFEVFHYSDGVGEWKSHGGQLHSNSSQ